MVTGTVPSPLRDCFAGSPSLHRVAAAFHAGREGARPVVLGACLRRLLLPLRTTSAADTADHRAGSGTFTGVAGDGADGRARRRSSARPARGATRVRPRSCCCLGWWRLFRRPLLALGGIFAL